MNKLNANEKKLVAQFVTVTGCTNTVAIKQLKKYNWRVEVAVPEFLEHLPVASPASASSAQQAFTEQNLEKFFAQYMSKEVAEETNKKEIDAEGIMKLFEDLDVDPSDLVTLVLANKMNAEEMGKFTYEEFTRGMRSMMCDTLVKLKKKIPALRQELADPYAFKAVYEYTFRFSKDGNQKGLNLEEACAMWQLLLKDKNKWDLLDAWCEFLNREHKKAISADTWNQVLDFSRTYKTTLFGYDANLDKDAAWPVLIDEFVDNFKEKMKTAGMKI